MGIFKEEGNSLKRYKTGESGNNIKKRGRGGKESQHEKKKKLANSPPPKKNRHERWGLWKKRESLTNGSWDQGFQRSWWLRAGGELIRGEKREIQ